MNEIATLNDHIRRHLERPHPPHQVVLTAGVARLEPEELAAVVSAVKHFDAFGDGNDPYGEHDFGKVVVDGDGYCFNFDYYDDAFEFHRENGNRVLTIMAAHEY